MKLFTNDVASVLTKQHSITNHTQTYDDDDDGDDDDDDDDGDGGDDDDDALTFCCWLLLLASLTLWWLMINFYRHKPTALIYNNCDVTKPVANILDKTEAD